MNRIILVFANIYLSGPNTCPYRSSFNHTYIKFPNPKSWAEMSLISYSKTLHATSSLTYSYLRCIIYFVICKDFHSIFVM